eukprot:CAMPEP_0119319804 /NCGR_PEP_ID=MMETSP1333-20130426/50387_1 /TAXON_ID=418940 /ORGANISM="Scyphosphaera apsteinii, Strain RCC1455" /LENGTH=297 /DNA_ID=CAMNT_0007326303 /DNA_START=57 /DNA_END=947 /DNA_ORIENTATION=+
MLALQEAAVLRGHRGSVLSVSFNNDGNYCMSGGDDRRVLLWNPRREATELVPIKEYSGHSQRVLDVVISHDNASFSSCGEDRAVFLWDVSSGRVTRRFVGHTQRVNAVAFNAESTVLISGSYDTSVRCWDCRSRATTPVQVLAESSDSVSSVAISGHEIFAASVDGVVRCYDLRAGTLCSDTIGLALTHVSLSHDSECMLVAALDSRLRLMDKGSGQLLNEYTGHQNNKFKLACCLSYDDAYVICGSEDGYLYMWDLVEPKQVARVRGHATAIGSVACDPKQMELLTAGYDGSIKLW